VAGSSLSREKVLRGLKAEGRTAERQNGGTVGSRSAAEIPPSCNDVAGGSLSREKALRRPKQGNSFGFKIGDHIH